MVLPLMLSGGGLDARCYVASVGGEKFDRVPDCSAVVGVLLLSRLSARELVMLWIPLAFCAGHIYYVTRIANFRRRERGSDGD